MIFRRHKIYKLIYKLEQYWIKSSFAQRAKILLYLSSLVGVGLYSSERIFSNLRFKLAEFRSSSALDLLKQEQNKKALLRAQTAHLLYPTEYKFLSVLSEVSRKINSQNYISVAKNLADHNEAKAEDALEYASKLIEIGNIQDAYKYLRLARERSADPNELEKLLFKIDILMGRPAIGSALLRGSKLIGELNDYDLNSTYAVLCPLETNPFARAFAIQKLTKWSKRNDELSKLAIDSLLQFSELGEQERIKILNNKQVLTSEKLEKSYLNENKIIIDLLIDTENIIEKDLLLRIANSSLRNSEKFAAVGFYYWRLGLHLKGRKEFKKSLLNPDIKELEIIELLILNTNDLKLKIDLLNFYKRFPLLKDFCYAHLVGLYHKIGNESLAFEIAKNFSLKNLRNNPDILYLGAKNKIACNLVFLDESIFEIERLVSVFPHDLIYLEFLAQCYFLSGRINLCLELIKFLENTDFEILQSRINVLKELCYLKINTSSKMSKIIETVKNRVYDDEELKLLRISL